MSTISSINICMSTVNYNNTSPYYTTPQNSWALLSWPGIVIPTYDTDQSLLLPMMYQYRPDLLAYDLYGTTRLWWCFSVRNPDVIKDPIYDFVAGIGIYITQKDALFSLLNL